MISIYEICRVTQRVLLEFSLIYLGVSSLISNISCTKQSNLLLYRELCLFEIFRDSGVFILIMFSNGRRQILGFTHALM